MNYRNYRKETTSGAPLTAQFRPNDCPKRAKAVEEILKKFDAESPCSGSSEIRAPSVADGLEVDGLNPSRSVPCQK